MTGPKFLLHIGGDKGPLDTIDLTVREDISEIFGAAVCHTHRVDTNGIFFVASKKDSPMTDVVSVGSIGVGDLLRLVSLDDT